MLTDLLFHFPSGPTRLPTPSDRWESSFTSGNSESSAVSVSHPLTVPAPRVLNPAWVRVGRFPEVVTGPPGLGPETTRGFEVPSSEGTGIVLRGPPVPVGRGDFFHNLFAQVSAPFPVLSLPGHPFQSLGTPTPPSSRPWISPPVLPRPPCPTFSDYLSSTLYSHLLCRRFHNSLVLKTLSSRRRAGTRLSDTGTGDHRGRPRSLG